MSGEVEQREALAAFIDQAEMGHIPGANVTEHWTDRVAYAVMHSDWLRDYVAARVASAAAEAWDEGRAVGRADDPRVRAEPNPYRAVLAAAHDEGSEQQGSMAPQANEAAPESDSGADVGGNATGVIRGAQRGDSA